MGDKWVEWPQGNAFSANQAEAFYDHVAHINSVTFNATIEELQDIRLSPAGRLAIDNSKLSLLAAKQLCQYLAAGLWTYVADVSGIVRKPGRVDQMLDPALAIAVINKTLELRFLLDGGLRRRQLVKNTATNVVDGIVGNKYRFLPHSRLYELAEEFLDGLAPPAKFHTALLHGRRLAMVFLYDEPLFQHRNRAIYNGYYFANSEAGQCSVSAASVIQVDGLRSLGNFMQLPHSGKTFVKRLNKKLGQVIAARPFRDAAALAAVDRRLARTLPIVIKSRPALARCQQLVRLLTAKKVDRRVAEAAVHHAVFGADADELPSATQVIEPPTNFDLWIWLMREASHLHIRDRELVERVAFGLLSGNLIPGDGPWAL